MNTRNLPRTTMLVFLIPAVAYTSAAYAQDALDEALGLVGLRRADLGWRPPGWWLGYPGDVPYKLRHFDDLLDQPLATISYTRSFAGAVRTYLAPEKVNAEPDRFGAGALFHLVYSVGVGPKYGAIRNYAPNTTAPDTPLDEAIPAVQRAAGRPTTFITFGMESPYPQLQKELAAKVAEVPPAVQPVLGRLVLNVLEAQRWAELAFRNVPGDKRIAVARKMNLGEEQVDALDYEPAVDDVARTWDEASLWYAGLKCVQALDTARLSLRAVAPETPPFAFDWETPYGWIRFRGSGPDVVDATDAWLIVDLGGDDCYTGPVGASAADRPIGLLLDLGGNDTYSGSGPAQGAGICGVGVLLDAAGHDRYEADRLAQGVGQFGLGACIDLEGDDQYFTRYSGQGCAYFGVGLLIDGGGTDTYKLYCDGQGFGGVSGVGILVDYSGNDAYEAVRDSNVTGRPSYHSPDLHVSVSNAQGCAMGRRGDGADGHSWAGGLGVLIDLAGDDSYLSGNWSMGTGYWFGTGLLYDGAGDDTYRGVVWSQATGAHFCIGVLVDEGGNDHHLVEENAVNSLAFGHDFAVALLVDLGGDDVYSVENSGLGQSINRSVAALIDVGGNDTYTTKAENRPGMAIFDEKLRDRSGPTTYFADATSVGLFLDVGGDDVYHCAPDAGNNTTWLDPPASDNVQVRNFSVGVDRESGDVNLLPQPEKRPR
ncbi:MAG: hypothetical protein V2A79_02100 [Planctomycetota bacterium]